MRLSQTLQAMLTKVEVSALVAQAAAGVEHAYGTTTDGRSITSSLRDAMDSSDDEEPLNDKRLEDKLKTK